MLELRVYDDIPHLLSPVVTEPHKAIRALKWTVEQMEERYRHDGTSGRATSASFNAKVREAKAKGEPLGRRVQTGYDPDTGEPIYESEELDDAVLPQIVVIVDELADLMMTAGKEVEFLIQRLAQKARAAGIHLIMATQRPSVDVITGVIKANLPTRISFRVTSKIDSRTILGEQGAEQLLGKGDMLYMSRRQADHPRPRPVRHRRGGRARGRRSGATRATPEYRGGHRGGRGRRLHVRRLDDPATQRDAQYRRPCRSSPRARRPRPATSSASCASATTAPPG